jgi:hypothetical protein
MLPAKELLHHRHTLPAAKINEAVPMDSVLLGLLGLGQVPQEGAAQWGAAQWGAAQWGAAQWGAAQWGAAQWGAAQQQMPQEQMIMMPRSVECPNESEKFT